jgi:hypothetical protein
MKKCQLLDYQNDIEKAVSHLNALANLLHIAGGQSTPSEAHQNECMSLLCDLSCEVKEMQLMISQGLSELYIIDDGCNSTFDNP